MSGSNEDNGRFDHDACAVALGGFMTRPFSEPLEAQAASVLPSVGGYGSARSENFRYHEIVSFRTAYTQVIGTEHVRDGRLVHETLASAVVEGLNVLDMVTADRVVARLTSSYPHSEKGQGAGPFRMRPLGSYFVNLRIAGFPIGDPCGHLKPRDALVAKDTKKAIHGECCEAHEGEGESCHRLHDFEEKSIGKSSPDRLRVPLFDLTQARVPGASSQPGLGCVLDIPDFGTIEIGRFTVEEERRKLEMLRIDLHSPEAGRLMMAAVEGNGRPY